MFRSVRLPIGTPGALRLHSMPGRREPLEKGWKQVRGEGVQLIVCLAGPEEIGSKSPAYAAALEAKTLPCRVQSFPVTDFGVPEDREAFWSLASEIARQVKAGNRILIHCGAGIGRTGTLATCVLLALGEPRAKAEQAVSSAGSHAETPEQRDLVAWCAVRSQPAK